MSGRRFMIRARAIKDGYATFDGELFNHIVRVLRLTTGERLTLVDEHGSEHYGIIDQTGRDWVVVRIVATQQEVEPESAAPQITVCQALPKGDKIDFILQKGTELGVHDFRIFGGTRSIVRLREEKQGSRLERWNRITAEASRQSGRRAVPGVSWHNNAAQLATSLNHPLRLLLWESEHESRLKTLLANLPQPASICLAIGPEGGFDRSEAGLLIANGFQPVTLGKRIMRTETAALATVAILQYIWGDI